MKPQAVSLTLITIITVSFLLPNSIALISNNVTINTSGTININVRPLHIEGRHIKDDLGNIVILRGVNKHGWEDHPDAHWIDINGNLFWATWDENVIAQNLDAMKSWGFNVVRMYDCVENWVNDLSNHRAKIKTLLSMLGERGMYLQYGFWNIVLGTGQIVLPYPPHGGNNSLITSEADFVDLWRNVATELTPHPNVLFELWNEPAPPTVDDKEIWFDVIGDCITAIREITDQIIVVQGHGHDLWVNVGNPPPENPAGMMEWVTDPRLQGTNILYSHHMYGDFFDWAPDRYYVYEYEDVKQALQYCMVEWALFTENKAIIIGEMGLCLNMLVYGMPEYNNATTMLIQFENELRILNEWGVSYVGFWWWPGGMLPLLEYGSNYPPNEVGQILIDAIAYS